MQQKDLKKKREPISVLIDEVHLNFGRARYVDNSGTEPRIREFPIEIHDAVLYNVTDPEEIIQQVVLKTMQKVGLNALVPDFEQFSSAIKLQAAAKIEEVKEDVSNFINELKQKAEESLVK